MFDKAAYYRAWRKKHPERSRAYSAKWRAVHPEKAAAHDKIDRGPHVNRLRNVRRLYGLTAAQYYEILGRQNGLCAICGMANDGRALCVDHEHVDGYDELPAHKKAELVRGLLCGGCNSIIGFCRDEPATVVRKATGLANINQYLGN